MRRREFITLVGGAAINCPMVARAQQRAVPLIGYLSAASPEPSAQTVAAFRKGLSEMGYVEGQNIAVEYRWASSDIARLPELATDLISRRVALIVAPGSVQAALAAKAASATIPTVFETTVDPVQAGLVASLNRPGGNITGVASIGVEITGKQLGLLKQLLPQAGRFSVLIGRNFLDSATVIKEAQATAAAIHLDVDILTAATNAEIDSAFASHLQNRADGLLVTPSNLFIDRRVQITSLATRHSVPAIYTRREFVEAGGLMSYGSSLSDQYRQVGVYAGRILKGEKPADLPVMQPTRFEFVINRQGARIIDINVPSTLLALADEVIE
jgi:putative tryptophan/tyrosine transport system substrate-binding protein